VVNPTPRPLYPQGEVPVPIAQEAGWTSRGWYGSLWGKSKSLLARVQFTAAMWLGTSLFWFVKQRYFVFIYRRFGRHYPSHLLQSCSPRRFLLHPFKMGKTGCPKR